MKNIFRSIGFVLALFPAVAFAQALVNQQASRGDAATFWQGPAGTGATSCTTVSTTAANDTVTVTPPGGNRVYVTQLLIQNYTDATGATQTGYVTPSGFANLGAAPVISIGTALTTVQGFPPPMVITFNPPLVGSAQGQVVAFTPSATQSAHNYLCMSAVGYFAP